MKVAIIEDEKITADDLIENILAFKPNYTIEKVLTSVSEAINYFKHQPDIDVIFSDIQLGDGLSFEIFKQIQIKVPVIFCTAYDEYALEAFRVNGIDYILKPFSALSLQKSIEKFETLTHKNNVSVDKLLSYLSIQPVKTQNISLLVYQKDIITPLNTNDIAIMQLINGTVKIVVFDGKIYFSTQTLEEIERLNLPYYFRANRQFLVHRKSIKDVVQHFNRKLLLRLTIPFEGQIFISKEKTPDFLGWLTSV